MRWPSRILLAVLFALPSSCGGESEPQYALRTVMLEVEIITKRLEGAILTPGASPKVEEHARTVRRWLEDPSVDRFLAGSDLKGTPAQFAELKASFDGVLDRLIEAAQSGDEDRTRVLYPSLRASCDSCHAVFRPDLQ